MIPAEVHVDAVPILGSGKIDFVTAREQVLERQKA
jgi:hypothetical protein